jgi:hypothetical protein
MGYQLSRATALRSSRSASYADGRIEAQMNRPASRTPWRGEAGLVELDLGAGGVVVGGVETRLTMAQRVHAGPISRARSKQHTRERRERHGQVTHLVLVDAVGHRLDVAAVTVQDQDVLHARTDEGLADVVHVLAELPIGQWTY